MGINKLNIYTYFSSHMLKENKLLKQLQNIFKNKTYVRPLILSNHLETFRVKLSYGETPGGKIYRDASLITH